MVSKGRTGECTGAVLRVSCGSVEDQTAENVSFKIPGETKKYQEANRQGKNDGRLFPRVEANRGGQ